MSDLGYRKPVRSNTVDPNKPENQSSLFDPKLQSEADKAFDQFDAENPHVYEKLVKMTRDLKAQGHKKIGMQMLFEVIRWKSMLQTTDNDFKMNNNYAGRYARKVMAEHTDLDGMFELRTLKS